LPNQPQRKTVIADPCALSARKLPNAITASEGNGGKKFSNAESAAIAKQVIHLRTRLGITQGELAKRVGTSYSQISRIESVRHEISHKTFRNVYRALGATPLVGYELPPRPGQPAHRELIPV